MTALAPLCQTAILELYFTYAWGSDLLFRGKLELIGGGAPSTTPILEIQGEEFGLLGP